MKKNVSAADKVVRSLLAIAIIILYFTGAIGGILAMVLGAVAAVLIFTSITGSCLVYTILGISTKKAAADPVQPAK